MKMGVMAPAFLLVLLVGLNDSRASATCYTGASSIQAYWTPAEGMLDLSPTGSEIELKGLQTRVLVDTNGAAIAFVAEVTFRRCIQEGQCYVKYKDEEGLQLLRYVGKGSSFELLDKNRFPFGVGAWNNLLQPFASVATSDFPPGTKLHIKELEGSDLDLLHVHNGCVRVDDVAPGAQPCSIRLFTGMYFQYRRLQAILLGQVHVQERSSCEILTYLPAHSL